MVSMGYVKHPRKFIESRIRDYGGVKNGRLDERAKDGRGTDWVFPDGQHMFVLDGIHMGHAAALVNELKRMYGHRRSDTPFNATKRSNAPQVDLTQLTASEHAKDRFRLMRTQDRLEFSDVLHAIRLPTRVLWSEVHQSWIWVGTKVSVAVKVLPSGSAVITTLLWSTEELWAANPRPEAATR